MIKNERFNRLKLSIVIPAFKQEKTIIKDVQQIEDTLMSLGLDYEILVVIDGLLDKTFENVKKIESKRIRIFSYEKNQGKGYAVKYGMLQAKGDIAGFIDAGMDISPAAISILLDYMDWYDADIVVGSKLHPESKVTYPKIRKILSWGYRILTHALFGFSIRDTQVGLKFFKKNVVEKVFPRILVKTFAFDVEILAVANYLGFRKIYEGPIELKFNNASSISTTSFLKIILNMLWDTLTVYFRLKILHYYDSKNKKKWMQADQS